MVDKHIPKVVIYLLSFTSITALLISFYLLTGFNIPSLMTLQYSNTSQVYMPEEFNNIINTRYSSDQDEFLYCLYGDVDGNNLTITEIKETSFSSTNEKISYTPCKRTFDFLGTIHSHPVPLDRRYRASCSLSDQDIYTFGSSNVILTGVICGENLIAFYTPSDFNLPIKYEVISNEI